MSLDIWLDQRFLVEHEASKQEISDLLDIVTTDLGDAQIPQLSPDRRLACCYQAILTAARAALHASGYRVSKGPNHHYYAIQSLQFTVGLDSATLRKIESIGKKRVMADYTRIGEVSQSMVEDAIALANTCCRQTKSWIREAYPELLQ
jgi:hypothetical protein